MVAVLAVTLTPLESVAPLRILVTLPWLLFAPGYALLVCLLPGDAPDRLERAVLSVGGSLVVALFGTLAVARGGVDTPTAVASLTLVTLGLTLLAAVQRRRLVGERYTPPSPNISGRLRGLEFSTSTDGLLNVALLVALLVTLITAGVATVSPPGGEQFTEVALVSQTDNDAYTVDKYPERLTSGEPTEFAVTVSNRERRELSYTLVVALQRPTGDGYTTLERFHTRSFTLEDGERLRWNHSVTPTVTGSRVRLSYLLYRGSAPASPTPENAYRELHLRVNVTEPTTQSLSEQKPFYQYPQNPHST
jgi:uncharacterized membrane protein